MGVFPVNYGMLVNFSKLQGVQWGCFHGMFSKLYVAVTGRKQTLGPNYYSANSMTCNLRLLLY